MRKLAKSLFVGAALLATMVSAQTPLPYKNSQLPIDIRVNDLVSRMTLKEKVSLMMYNAPQIDRLEIPAYN